jgi:3alpha(or 20beta)-hydroxysteroid dehydrogenase
MVRETNGDALADGLGKSVPLRRLGTTSEVADMVHFLASDEASYCTGSDLVIDVGLTAGLAPVALEL